MDSREMILPKAIELAHAYYNAGNRLCNYQSPEKSECQWANAIVGYTNLAFACEVSLKVIAKETGVGELKTHSLKELFEHNQEVTKNAISSNVVARYLGNGISNYTLEMFYGDLEENSKAFVEGRYWYERPEAGDKRQANILFLNYFALSLLRHVDLFNKLNHD